MYLLSLKDRRDDGAYAVLNRYIDESEFEGDKTLIKGILQKIYSEACEVD